jgi:hypothetical protein
MVFERTETKGYGDRSHPVTLPEGDRLLLSDNEWDAYCLFSDLCSETEASFSSTYQHFRKEPRSILKTHGVAPSFGLELIESILSGFADGFQSVSPATSHALPEHRFTFYGLIGHVPTSSDQN